MIACPPTYALYNPAYVQALRRACPVWLWTLRRIARYYHRQALMWLHLYHLAFRQYIVHATPRAIVRADGIGIEAGLA